MHVHTVYIFMIYIYIVDISYPHLLAYLRPFLRGHGLDMDLDFSNVLSGPHGSRGSPRGSPLPGPQTVHCT